MCTSSASSAGRHQHEVGQAAEIGDVEGSRVRRPVGADQPGAVDRKADRQALDRDVMHDLIVGALQEGRVDRGEGLEPFGGKAGREGDGVLLGDADVEAAVRKFLFEQVEPGARWHRCGDGNDLVVLARFLDQALARKPSCTAVRPASTSPARRLQRRT